LLANQPFAKIRLTPAPLNILPGKAGTVPTCMFLYAFADRWIEVVEVKPKKRPLRERPKKAFLF